MNPRMKVEVRVGLFGAPQHATVHTAEGVNAMERGQTIALSEIDPGTLDYLAEHWLTELYSRARQPNPWTRSVRA